MASITFKHFISLLPPESTLKAEKTPSGLSSVEASSPYFVEPDFNVERAIEPSRTSVVLLSAPGAVGKSTLASELSFRSGAKLWDLSKIQVGDRTFPGTIMEAYGYQACPSRKPELPAPVAVMPRPWHPPRYVYFPSNPGWMSAGPVSITAFPAPGDPRSAPPAGGLPANHQTPSGEAC